MRHRLLLLLLLALPMVLVGGHLADTEGPGEPLPAAAPIPQPEEPEAVLTALTSAGPETQETKQADPYRGALSWCEPLTYDQACETHAECADIAHVGTRQLRCLHPWWAKWDKAYKVCAPGEVMRSERVWREARLRELVAQSYFDEPEHCPDWSWEPLGKKGSDGNVRFPRGYRRTWENGKATWEQHWRCTQQTVPAERLATFLGVVYGRETSKRPWKRHRLNPDATANKQAWVNQARAYGWEVDLECDDGRAMIQQPDGRWRDEKGRACGKKRKLVVANFRPDPDAAEHNPYYGERWRWQYGLGGYGKNSAYGVQDWDKMAPPEILCLEVPGTEAYLRDARTAILRYTGVRAPSCDGAPYRGRAHKLDENGEETWVDRPSWHDVHRVASGGKWCPKNTAKAAKQKAAFAKRMNRVGLDPDAPVGIEDLGRPLPKVSQVELAATVRTRVDAVLPPPWRG
jgi:hypothetical protein